jgi:hypothetical protein
MAGLFEQWINNLRFAFADPKFKAIWGTIARVVGDDSRTRAVQAINETQPLLATDDTSIALLAAERQIDVDPAASTATTAARLPFWLQAWERAGTPAGLLLALTGAGFENALLVQQNGWAWNLSALNAAVPAGTTSASIGDATYVIWKTALGPNPHIAGPQALAFDSSQWWTFDAYGTDANGNQWNNRFAVLFPAGQPVSTLANTANLERIRTIVARWTSKKNMGFFVNNLNSPNSGLYFGWPVRTFGYGGTFGPNAVISYSP